MKVLVVNNMAPFTWGGAEELVVNLRNALSDAGHEAEIMRLPFRWDPPTRIPSQMLYVLGLELANVDRVIALKFPAYLIRHPHKTVWLLHQYRQAYDLYEAGMSNLTSDATGSEMRRLIHEADAEAFAGSRKIFVNSDVTQDRLMKFSGVRSEVLRPPLNDPQLFVGGRGDGYVFAGGRVNAMKRQLLLVESLAHAPGVRLVIAGPPDSPADARQIEQAAERVGVRDRVTFNFGFLPRSEIAQLVNQATAIACLPFDEDSLSYVAMEGAAAAKPILTASDSGGVLKLVDHLETGYVADPSPESLGEGLRRVTEGTATQMGEAAKRAWRALEITWPNAVERLVS